MSSPEEITIGNTNVYQTNIKINKQGLNKFLLHANKLINGDTMSSQEFNNQRCMINNTNFPEATIIIERGSLLLKEISITDNEQKNNNEQIKMVFDDYGETVDISEPNQYRTLEEIYNELMLQFNATSTENIFLPNNQ